MTHKRKTRLLILLFTTVVTFTIYCLLACRPHVSEIFITQRPGEPKITWHTMETLWEKSTQPRTYGSDTQSVLLDGGSVYGAAFDTVTKFDKRSGRVLWKKKLTRHGESLDRGYSWYTQMASESLVSVLMSAYSGAGLIQTTRVRCLHAKNGAAAWDAVLDTPAASNAVVSGTKILIPLTSGEVCCLSTASGTQLWRTQVSTTHFDSSKRYRAAVLTLSADDSACVACVGDSHFIGIDTATGENLWSRTLSGSMRHAEQIDSGAVPFTVGGGVVYVVASTSRTAAWSASTGQTLWRNVFPPLKGQQAGGSGYSPIIAHGMVLVHTLNSWAALRCTDGKPAWSRIKCFSPYTDDLGQVYSDVLNPLCDTAYVFVISPPVIDHVQRLSRALPFVTNIAAIDLNTGVERWRIQTDEIEIPQSIVPDGRMLYCDGYDRFAALAPGPVQALPHTHEGRAQLAYRMLEDLAQWSPRQDTGLAKLMKRLSLLRKQAGTDLIPSSTRDKINILRMQDDSIGPLLDLVDHQVNEMDSGSNATLAPQRGMPRRLPLRVSVDLLYDLRAVSGVPRLIKDLQKTKSPIAGQLLAELLIRLNSATALDALFEYAQQCKDIDGPGGEETMAYVCRVAPTGKVRHVGSLTQERLTQYLASALAHNTAAGWLRRFAQFELLRNRGSAERELALTFRSSGATSPLIPTMVQIAAEYSNTQGASGATFKPAAKARDSSGAWWGAFVSDYYNQNDLWIVQSNDGKHWGRPTVCLPQVGPPGDGGLAMRLIGSGGAQRLKLYWKDNNDEHTVRYVPLESIYRDSDGDGVPDIVERELGTNPLEADSKQSGLKDADNKNPMYQPHTLSREEQIYEAVIEATCQFSRFTSKLSPGDGMASEHWLYGRNEQYVNWDLYPKHGLQCPWFPCQESADKSRARVGVYGRGGKLDVEVDLIGGKWLPVECRVVNTGRGDWEAAAPVRPAGGQ